MQFWLKKIFRAPFALQGSFQQTPPGISFLIYHKVSAELPFELDLPQKVFQQQMYLLKESGTVLSIEAAVEKLQSGASLSRDHYVITFDDGFSDFASYAYPVLKELNLPAVLYVTTGFIESDSACSMLSRSVEAPLHPLTWMQLEQIHADGLVTLGAHTHGHGNFDQMSKAQIDDDLAVSSELFLQRLGVQPMHFAYPRARWSLAADDLVRRRFASAVLSGSCKVYPSGYDLHKIPRIPIRRSDGMLFFQARISGRLAAEESFYAGLKRVRG